MRNRWSIATPALAVALMLTTGGPAWAQGAGGAPIGGTRTFATAGGTRWLTPGYSMSTSSHFTLYGSSSSVTSGVSGYTSPYSYYAAIPPAPARRYVDYAESGFNYYGRPYGHPGDRWSWSALGSNQRLLDRYYYPPVR